MKIGGEYNLKEIGFRHWQKFARETRVNSDALIARLSSMAKQLPDELTAARKRTSEQGLKGAIVARLATQLIERAAECQRILEQA